jgi:hypothetical protein
MGRKTFLIRACLGFVILTLIGILTYQFLKKPPDTISRGGGRTLVLRYPGDIEEAFADIANGLARDLQMRPERWQGKELRVERAIQLLRNGGTDEEVILLEARAGVSPEYPDHFLKVRYLDETMRVNRVAYRNEGLPNYEVTICDSNSLQKVLNRIGSVSLWVFIKGSPDTSLESVCRVPDNERVILLLNEKLYEDIISRRGSLCLFDSNDVMLDIMSLEKLSHDAAQ